MSNLESKYEEIRDFEKYETLNFIKNLKKEFKVHLWLRIHITINYNMYTFIFNLHIIFIYFFYIYHQQCFFKFSYAGKAPFSIPMIVQTKHVKLKISVGPFISNCLLMLVTPQNVLKKHSIQKPINFINFKYNKYKANYLYLSTRIF